MASTKDSLNDATRKLKSSNLVSESSLNLAKHQIIRTSSQSIGNAIKAIGDIANMTAFTNGTVIFSGSNITINTSVSGTRQYLILSADNVFEGLNSVYAGDNISLSIDGVSTTVSVTGLENYAYSWHSHDGLYFDISNSSLLQAISDNSLSLAASQSVNFINTSLSSKFLTTAAASNHIHGIASGTNITIGSSSNGLALSVGNYLTTAALSNHSHTYSMNAIENNGGTSFSTVGTATNSNGNINFYPYGGLSVGLRNNNDIDIGLPAGIIPSVSISGNTNGTPSVLSSGTAIFAGGNNITLSQNGNTISVIGAAAGTGGAGTGFTSSSTTGINVVGTLDSAGISIGIPSYITTAMQSNAGSNFIGLNTAITNGSMTANSNGISIDLPSVSATASNSVIAGNYISLSTNGINTTISVVDLQATSAMSLYQAVSNSSLSLGTAAANSFINTAFSSLFQLTSDNSLSLAISNTSLLQAVSNSSLSLGTGYTTHTHSQYINISNSSYFANSTHAHSQYAGISHTHGAVALTGGIGATSASNGFSLSIPSYALSTHTHSQYVNSTDVGSLYFSNTNGITWSSSVNSNSTSLYVGSISVVGGNVVGTSTSTVTTTGSALKLSANTAGLSLSVPNWITTAAAGGGVALQGSGTYSQNTGTVQFANSNGISFGLSNNSMTASYTVPTVPTTGSLYFADTNGVTFTASTSGSSTTISASVSAFSNSNQLSTYFAQTNHTHGSLSLALSNLSGTYSSANNGLTISLTGNTGGTATGGADGYNIIAAGTQTAGTTGTIVFSNSNNISFGMSNSSIVTASFSQSTHDHPYISTANSSLFQHTSATSAITSAAFPSANTTNFAGIGTSATNVSLTLNSNGLAISVASPTGGNVAISGGTSSVSLNNLVFSNSNGISFGLNGSTMTASHNGLTTAMASNAGSNFVGLNSAVTNITDTINSRGISISNPGWLTTAAASNHSHGNPTLALTNLTGTTASSSNGFTISLSASTWAGVGTTTATTSGTALKLTLNTAGLNISYPNALTTAAASDHSHGNPTLNLTNISGTTASASNGLTLSLSAPPQGNIFFVNSNGHSFSSSTSGVSTSIWIVT